MKRIRIHPHSRRELHAMAVDAGLIAASFWLAFTMRYFHTILSLPEVPQGFLEAYVRNLVAGALYLAFGCIFSSRMLGVYSSSREIGPGVQAAVVFQSVSLGYLFAGFSDFFFPHIFWFSRGALLASYGCTLVAMLWRHADRSTLVLRGMVHWGRGSAVRMIADIFMLAISFTLALVIRYSFIPHLLDAEGQALTLVRYIRIYIPGLLFIVPANLAAYTMLGVYSKSRSYQNRFKALIIFEGISIGYLVAGFSAFFFSEIAHFSRGAFFTSYFITLCLILFSRFWATLWRRVISEETTAKVAAGEELEEQRRVLIIGGAGYIGTALIPLLLDTGYKVRILDLMLYGREPVSTFDGNAGVEIIQEDFRMVDTVVRAMREVGAVVHLGAIVGDPACKLDEEYTKEVNLMATKTIADVAKGQGVRRFVFASTCSVYGASSQVLDEQSRLNPLSLYAMSKVACERVLFSLSTPLFQPTILRLATIYGLSKRTRFDLVVNMLTARALFEKRITVSGADQWRPFLHVEDAARAMFLTLRAPLERVGTQIFNVGADEQNFTIGKVAEMINSEVPEAKIESVPFEGERRNYRVDFGKIRWAVNFAPKWSLKEGIAQVSRAIREGRVTDYKDPLYSNVTYLMRQVPDHLLSREREWLEEQLKKVE